MEQQKGKYDVPARPRRNSSLAIAQKSLKTCEESRARVKWTSMPPEFKCVNCKGAIPITRQIKLFCLDLCKDEAKYVRYYRSCMADGRVGQADVQMALRIQRAFLLSGGYNARERNISNDIREAVIASAGSRCSLCGKHGTEIDHILGTSDELSNLQLLCWSCHTKKTAEGFKELTPDHPRYKEIMRRVQKLDDRIYAIIPVRECDNEEKWDDNYRTVLKKRKQTYERWIHGAVLPLVKNRLSARKITIILNSENVPSFSGKCRWDHKTIARIIKTYGTRTK